MAFVLVLVGISARADSMALINGIISRGNNAYDLSQRTRIKECADSASMFLVSGGFHENDSIDLLASIYKLYGNYHYENSDLDSAEIYYNKSMDLISENPFVAFRVETKLLLNRDLSQLYYFRKDYAKAKRYIVEADDIIEGNNLYDLGDDRWLITKLTYAMCLARMKEFDKAIGIAETELSNAIDKTNLSYAKAQRMYAKILMLANVDKIGALKAYKNYFEKQRQEAISNFGMMDDRQRNEYWQTLRPFIADCYRLENEDAGFLYDVTLFSKGLLLHLARMSGNDVASESAIKPLSYKWEDVQKRLKSKQCAIEFIQYEKDCTPQMAAIVLKSSGKPRFVPMTSPAEIISLVGGEIQSTDRTNKDKLYGDKKLHTLIWTDSLMKVIAGTERIYFAPDGYLHRLAIEYMPPVKKYEIYRLTSTRKLMDEPTVLSSSSPALFVGGVNYDLDKMPGKGHNNDAHAYKNYIGKSFPRLSESSNEAKSIYESHHNAADTLIMYSKASEKVFMGIASNYESILVSTHGDFCSSSNISTDIKTSDVDESMSQNIMAFAGVNAYLQDKNFKADNHYDGLLSAKEISQLDLSRCKLFTISACQSALGYISSDGVFGLQRGLKNAGVEVMLLSLWNVHSDATSMLMKSFYDHLKKGMSMRRAFASARNYLMSMQSDAGDVEEIYVFDPATMSSNLMYVNESKSFNTPQYVDAFIMIDALE